MQNRRYLPSLSDLLDRLSIVQLKDVKIPENKTVYVKEIEDIVHDIQMLLDESEQKVTAELLRDLIVLAQFNTHIFVNESEARKGNKDGNLLIITHSINGIRAMAKNRITNAFGGRIDLKVDCLAADAEHWRPSGY